uniref:Uncharacterized protein n=1 Tax=Knipowitschia caucasica TaxID=637954 RepID=A0AAV2JAR7_KNICA
MGPLACSSGPVGGCTWGWDVSSGSLVRESFLHSRIPPARCDPRSALFSPLLALRSRAMSAVRDPPVRDPAVKDPPRSACPDGYRELSTDELRELLLDDGKMEQIIRMNEKVSSGCSGFPYH